MKPWEKTYSYINSRCSSKKNFYWKNGIKSMISKEDLKRLWFRDKAYLMKRPSIDRIDRSGNYEFSNCRYIELSENRINRRGKWEGGKYQVAWKNNYETDKRITVEVTPSMHRKVKSLTAKNGTTIREVLVNLLTKYLKEKSHGDDRSSVSKSVHE